MTTATADGIEIQLVEHEHARIRAGLANLQDAIAGAHAMNRSQTLNRVTRALAWLRRDVLPHAAWEEAWLYPRLDRGAQTPWATRALRLEHDQIREVATALEAEFLNAEQHWSPEVAFRLLVAMTRLETLVSAHLAQEYWFVRPLLEQTDFEPAEHEQPEPQQTGLEQAGLDQTEWEEIELKHMEAMATDWGDTQPEPAPAARHH